MRPSEKIVHRYMFGLGIVIAIGLSSRIVAEYGYGGASVVGAVSGWIAAFALVFVLQRTKSFALDVVILVLLLFVGLAGWILNPTPTTVMSTLPVAFFAVWPIVGALLVCVQAYCDFGEFLTRRGLPPG